MHAEYSTSQADILKKQRATENDVITTSADYESSNPLERYYQQRKVKLVFMFVREIMKKNPQNLVDLGCGKGIFLTLAKSLNRKVLCTGVDFGRKNCESTQQKNNNAICGNIEFPPFKSNSIDVVFLLDVIEHLHGYNILSEIQRVLKDGGELLLSTPNKLGVYEHKQLVYAENVCLFPQDIWNGLKGKPRTYAPYHVKLYSNRDLMQVLQDHGFLILDYTTEGFCFPLLGTMINLFPVFKRKGIFEKRIMKILEFFEKKFWVLNFLIVIHARKQPTAGIASK
jgi:ubiquinone/menaquinone biosynthesis C-methylase UbiE